jgi:hypothetical protein
MRPTGWLSALENWPKGDEELPGRFRRSFARSVTLNADLATNRPHLRSLVTWRLIRSNPGPPTGRRGRFVVICEAFAANTWYSQLRVDAYSNERLLWAVFREASVGVPIERRWLRGRAVYFKSSSPTEPKD